MSGERRGMIRLHIKLLLTAVQGQVRQSTKSGGTGTIEVKPGREEQETWSDMHSRNRCNSKEKTSYRSATEI